MQKNTFLLILAVTVVLVGVLWLWMRHAPVYVPLAPAPPITTPDPHQIEVPGIMPIIPGEVPVVTPGAPAITPPPGDMPPIGQEPPAMAPQPPGY